MAEEYKKFILKEYKYWILYLHDTQYPYIGRCYAWAKREKAAKVVDMTKEERDELFDVIVPKWYEVITKLYNMDWPNVCILGNTEPHLHAHLIPRYHSKRTFYGQTFFDANPTKNYTPFEKKPVPMDTVMKIKQHVQELVNKQ